MEPYSPLARRKRYSTSNGRRAAQAAILVAHGGDHIVRAVAAAILAQMPAFLLEPSATCRGGEHLLYRPHPVRWIEQGKRLADRLFGSVPIQRPGAGVPACDATVAVEHENGAVLDRVDDQLGAAFALPQFLFDRISALDVILQAQVRELQVPRAAAGGLEKIG